MAKKIYNGKVSGKRGRSLPLPLLPLTPPTSVDLRKHSIEDTRGRSRKKHKDPPKGMYEKVDDSGRGERGM